MKLGQVSRIQRHLILNRTINPAVPSVVETNADATIGRAFSTLAFRCAFFVFTTIEIVNGALRICRNTSKPLPFDSSRIVPVELAVDRILDHPDLIGTDVLLLLFCLRLPVDGFVSPSVGSDRPANSASNRLGLLGRFEDLPFEASF